jgi:hypothetical protein
VTKFLRNFAKKIHFRTYFVFRKIKKSTFATTLPKDQEIGNQETVRPREQETKKTKGVEA